MLEGSNSILKTSPSERLPLATPPCDGSIAKTTFAKAPRNSFSWNRSIFHMRAISPTGFLKTGPAPNAPRHRSLWFQAAAIRSTVRIFSSINSLSWAKEYCELVWSNLGRLTGATEMTGSDLNALQISYCSGPSRNMTTTSVSSSRRCEQGAQAKRWAYRQTESKCLLSEVWGNRRWTGLPKSTVCAA